jgi:cell division protein FtsW (lipid II flippase)
LIFSLYINRGSVKRISWTLVDGWGKLVSSMSSDERDPDAEGSNVFSKFAVASVLLMVYTLVRDDLGLSAVFFTLATFLYMLDIRRRPGRLYIV